MEGSLKFYTWLSCASVPLHGHLDIALYFCVSTCKEILRTVVIELINIYSTFYIATGWISDAGNVVPFWLDIRVFYFFQSIQNCIS